MNRVILAKQTDETAQFDRIYETFHVRIPNDVVAFLKQNSRGIPKEKALSGTKDLFVSVLSPFPKEIKRISSLLLKHVTKTPLIAPLFPLL